MGKPRISDPSLLVIGVIYSHDYVVDTARQRLQKVVGNLRAVGEKQSFNWTQYYQKEMGEKLRRLFWVGEQLVPRHFLADLKLITNQIEQELAREDKSRTINLDPGLLSAENFVLATTKGYSHRIYLREGIYAEVTLICERGKLEPLRWTYPDYRSEDIRQLLGGLRIDYIDQLRSSSYQVLKEVHK